ncbi:MAG: hypothetical protein Q9183_000068 [Haloplaca sp. 2 TL-2023]
MAVVHLDGSTDWMAIGPSLLAWTGQTLTVKPTVDTKMTRAARLNDVLTNREVNEIAEAPPGSVQKSLTRNIEDVSPPSPTAKTKPPQMSTASIGADGHVIFTKGGSPGPEMKR